MEIDRKELKTRAREAMGATQPSFRVVALVYLLMTTGVGYLLFFIPAPTVASGFSTLVLFATIFLALYAAVVGFGYDLWSLWASRGLSPGLGSLIQGFSVAGRVIFMEFIILARIFLWCIPLSFLMLMAVEFFAVLIPNSSLVVILIGAGLYAAIWSIMLRYALAPYLLADHPDDGAAAAVRRSVELTRGWKWELFKLEFSFVGWQLLALALTGVAMAAALWQAGFFQLLAAIPAGQLPDLIPGYFLWQNGLTLEAFAAGEQQAQLYALYASVSNGLWAALLADLLTLPLLLWLTPYHRVARAGFYTARLQLQQEGAPPV